MMYYVLRIAYCVLHIPYDMLDIITIYVAIIVNQDLTIDIARR